VLDARQRPSLESLDLACIHVCTTLLPFGAIRRSSLISRQDLTTGLQPVSAKLRRFTPGYASCGDWYRVGMLCTVLMVHACGLASQLDVIVSVSQTRHFHCSRMDVIGAGACFVNRHCVATVISKLCRGVRYIVELCRVGGTVVR
jgi:hypothetical protein